MSLSKKELEIVKQLVNTSTEKEYIKKGDKIVIVLKTEAEILINIADDLTVKDIPPIIITFDSNHEIDKLDIVINSGEYHHNRTHEYEKIIGADQDYTDYANLHLKLKFKCNNPINKLSVAQVVYTGNIYSHSHNKYGFSPARTCIIYDTDKYKNIKFKGALKIRSKHNITNYVDKSAKKYDLLVKL